MLTFSRFSVLFVWVVSTVSGALAAVALVGDVFFFTCSIIFVVMSADPRILWLH